MRNYVLSYLLFINISTTFCCAWTEDLKLALKNTQFADVVDTIKVYNSNIISLDDFATTEENAHIRKPIHFIEKDEIKYVIKTESDGDYNNEIFSSNFAKSSELVDAIIPIELIGNKRFSKQNKRFGEII